MFERFTDRARRVVVLAQEESRLLKHNYIGTEHLLLGLVHEGEGVAAQALAALGIPLDAVRGQVEEIIGHGGSEPSGQIPFTPGAKSVLELALREALQLGHNYIGTEHILLGLVREGEGVAAQVLVTLGADLSRVRQQVIDLLTGRAPKLRVSASVGTVDDPGAMRSGEPLQRSLDRLVLRRFTVSGCRALLLSESEALRVGRTAVGPVHLLLGLIAEGEGRAAAALGALGVDLAGARWLAEQTPGRELIHGVVRTAYRDDALDALERGLVEALAVDSTVIDTHHLLLGLVQQAERAAGPARVVFEALGTSPTAVRAAVANVDASAGAEAGADAGSSGPAPDEPQADEPGGA